MSAAAGGGGAEQDLVLAVNEKMNELKTFLTETLEVGQPPLFLSRSGNLQISIQLLNGKTHTINFYITKGYNIKTKKITWDFKNKCIEISINNSSDTIIETYIEANKPRGNSPGDGRCFSPLLTSDPAGFPNRVTTTDVLQILKTKLLLAMEISDIYLTDAAKIFIENTNFLMTPFRLLRGDNPFYQKYGYFSPTIEKLKEIIKSLTFGDLKKYTVEDARAEYRTLENLNAIFEKLFKKYPNETPLTQVMKEISIETEIKNGMEKFPKEKTFSYSLFDSLLMNHEKELMEKNKLYFETYFFNENSPEWQKVKQTVLIKDFSFTEDLDARFPMNRSAGKGGRRQPKTRRINIRHKYRNGSSRRRRSSTGSRRRFTR
jgi:hypothetical protein